MGNGTQWKDYFLHFLMVVAIALASGAWASMHSRIEYIDKNGTSMARERIAVVEIRLEQINKQMLENAETRRRIEEKLDMLIFELQSLQ